MWGQLRVQEGKHRCGTAPDATGWQHVGPRQRTSRQQRQELHGVRAQAFDLRKWRFSKFSNLNNE